MLHLLVAVQVRVCGCLLVWRRGTWTSHQCVCGVSTSNSTMLYFGTSLHFSMSCDDQLSREGEECSITILIHLTMYSQGLGNCLFNMQY